MLAAQFESFRDPFIILAGSVPLAISGALLFSFLGLTTLNIYSQVGLITLVGLVSKNGILIVQFANHLQETGLDKLAAVIEAAGTRLRPILMTTAATVVGHFSARHGDGPGAGARNSIGIMLVSGMIIGTVFTLFVVPSIYMLVARKRAPAPSADDVRRCRRSAVAALDRRRCRTRPMKRSTRMTPRLIATLVDGQRAGRLHGRSRLPPAARHDAADLPRRRRRSGGRRVAGRPEVVRGVQGRAAAGDDPHGARAELRSP